MTSQFPSQDKKWVEVLNYVKRLKPPKDKIILAPEEFYNIDTIYNPSFLSYFHGDDFSDISYVIIHKGRIEEYSKNFLNKLIIEGKYIFGNEVFVVYSLLNEKKREDDVHLNALLVKLKEKKEKIANMIHRKSDGKKRIIVTCAFSMGNLGDNLLAIITKEMVKTAIPEAKVTIIPPPVPEKEIEKADGIVLGGGGLLYDTKFQNIKNYMYPLFYAKKQKKFAAAIGQGVQGIVTPLGREIYKEVLDSLDLLTVRGYTDFNILKNRLKLQMENMHVTPDLVFAYRKIFNNIFSDGFGGNGAKKNLYLTFTNTKKLPESKIYEKYINTLHNDLHFINDYGFDTSLILTSQDDMDLYKYLRKKFKYKIVDITEKYSENILRYYSADSLVVSTRYHGVILGILSGGFVVAVGSKNNKQNRLYKDFFEEYIENYYDISEFTSDKLKNVLDMYMQGKLLKIDSMKLSEVEDKAYYNITLLKQAWEKYKSSLK